MDEKNSSTAKSAGFVGAELKKHDDGFTAFCIFFGVILLTIIAGYIYVITNKPEVNEGFKMALGFGSGFVAILTSVVCFYYYKGYGDVSVLAVGCGFFLAGILETIRSMVWMKNPEMAGFLNDQKLRIAVHMSLGILVAAAAVDPGLKKMGGYAARHVIFGAGLLYSGVYLFILPVIYLLQGLIFHAVAEYLVLSVIGVALLVIFYSYWKNRNYFYGMLTAGFISLAGASFFAMTSAENFDTYDRFSEYFQMLAFSLPVVGLAMLTEQEMKKARNELAYRRIAETALQKALKVKGEFLATVSHELRTPLTAIKEGVGIVLDGSGGDINDVQKSFLEIARRNIDRLSKLISDVLDFQKLDKDRADFTFTKNVISRTVLEATSVFNSAVPENGNVIKYNLDTSLEFAVYDEQKIRLVIQNLISNANRATKNGVITLSTRGAGNIFLLSVKDTGCGIKDSDKEQIFGEFKQLGELSYKTVGGTGLGLAISRRIVEAHGGKIWVESEYGKGSEFIMELPLRGDIYGV